MTINSLPDSIFVEIFAFYLLSIPGGHRYTTGHAWEWQLLVQVCQRWKQIIYGSPRYLDLHLPCSDETPFKNLSRWPEFPLTLDYYIFPDVNGFVDIDDLMAALEQPDRVHFIDLRIEGPGSRVDEVLAKMKVPFPALRGLDLTGPPSYDKREGIVLPRGFLGGSAPCLQYLSFEAVNALLFQELHILLLSARNLISLQLEDIPKPGYVSPEAIVGGLAGLTKLRTLFINFRFPEETPNSNEGLEHRRRPEPPIRAVLPALTRFGFSGESAYLEDIAAQFDMPSIEVIDIEYFLPRVEVCQLSRFIGRTENLYLAQFRHAKVYFGIDAACSNIKLDHSQGERRQVRFSLGVKIPDSDRHPAIDDLVACMTRVLGQLTALLSNVRHLSLKGDYGRQAWDEECYHLDDSKLLQLLHLFPAVEALHVTGLLVEHIATLLDNIDEERVSEVMPALRSLQLGNGDGPVRSTERFLSLRQLSGHPVAMVNIETQPSPSHSSLND